MRKNKIFIRVDSGTKVGYGHLIRCLALAEYLQKDWKINFISRSLPGNIIHELEIKKFQVFRLKSNSNRMNQKNDAEKSISLIKKYGGEKNLVIVDNYELSKQWETHVKPYVKKLIVIDDLMNRKHYCDLIIDQNLHTKMNGLYEGLVPNQCLKLLGPKYSMLRNQFIKIRKSVKIRTFPIKKILVSFGGSDIKNQTMTVLKTIKKANLDVYVDVIVGNSNSKKKIIKKLCNRVKKFNYHEQTNNIAKLMLSSDLSIGSGGSTTWERCCIGLPAIISIASEDQRDVANAVSKKKCIINLGDEKKLKESDYLDAITSLKRNDLKKMSKKALTLVDGKGTERISRFIFSRFGND